MAYYGFRKDRILTELKQLRQKRKRISMKELQNVLLGIGIVHKHIRKDFVMWLEAIGEIVIEGQIIHLISDDGTDITKRNAEEEVDKLRELYKPSATKDNNGES